MNASFGLDHPLIAVRDIEELRNTLISIGFNMTAVGKHPWGTSTSLAMFDGCLLEIMGVFDESLLDEVPAGEFRFGRHVHRHLQQREGVALTALHSTDSVNDAAAAQLKGFDVSGHLEFGRDVVLPGGRSDRTKTTLALMPDAGYPRLSFFLCQQHRPELIYVPEWLQHRNTVCGIAGVTVLAGDADRAAVVRKLSKLYGEAEQVEGGYQLTTANGTVDVLAREAIEASFGPLPSAVADAEPAIVAMQLRYAEQAAFEACLVRSGFAFAEQQGVYTLSNPELTGGTFLRFCPA